MTGRGLTCTAEKASDHLSFLFMRPPAVKLPPVQLLSPYVSLRDTDHARELAKDHQTRELAKDPQTSWRNIIHHQAGK